MKIKHLLTSSSAAFSRNVQPNRKRSFLLFILLCSAVMAYTQAPSQTGSPMRLTPQEAVDHAIRNNLMLETARIATDIQRRGASHAWNQFLPSAMVTGTMARSNWPNTVQAGPISMDLPLWNVTGGFTASLDFSLALVEAIRTSELEYRAGLLTFEKARLQIEQNVRKMYNQILLLEANAELLEDSFNNAVRQAEIAEANFNAGLAPRLAWIQAQVAVENMRPAMNNLQNNLNSLKGHFALILGLPHDTLFELESVPLDVSPLPENVMALISRAATGNPDVHELLANINVLQSQRKALQLSQFTPFLRLGWTVSSMFDPMLDPFGNSWFNGDHWTRSGQAGGNFSLTLGMSLNGFFGFTREGQQRKNMEASLQIQNIMLAQTIRDTELEIFTKIDSLQTILTTLEVQQATVDLADLSHRLTEEAYRAGLEDFQSLRNAALAYQQARLQLLTQQYNFLNDLIDLEYSIGVPFGTLSSIQNF